MSEPESPAVVLFEVSSVSPPPQARDDDGNFTERRGFAATQLARVDLGQVTQEVGRIVERMANTFKPRAGGPCQCEVEFAIKVTADGGIVVSKVGGEMSLKVKVVWDRS